MKLMTLKFIAVIFCAALISINVYNWLHNASAAAAVYCGFITLYLIQLKE